jgi:peptide subunit release factor 1 (eRF1)/intein/homing endonuclease
MSEKTLELKKLIEELEKIKGRHTELISVYIPSGYNLVEVSNQLMQEKSTAANIKSKTTRKNVLAALEKIIQHLKLFKETPPNGLVIFCGNVSPVEGREDIKLWSFEPPEKMNVKIYWCDQVFVLDPLKELIREKEVFGLVVLDAREATIGLLRGKNIVPLKHLESTVPSKTVKGGMCISQDSLIQLEDGKIIEIKDFNPREKILSFSFQDFCQTYASCKGIFKRKVKRAYEIITKEPAMRLVASPEHKVFVIKEDGIKEVSVDELKTNDRLLAVSNSVPPRKIKDPYPNKLCQLLGYMLGDGTLDNNRIILYEKDPQVVEVYKKIIRKTLKKEPRERLEGKTHEIRIYSKTIIDWILKEFPLLLAPRRKRRIPLNLTKLSSKKLCSFLRGLFDAEGYVSQNQVCIRLSNKEIINTLQLLLLRLGIVSSRSGLDKFKRYNLQISEPISVRKFYEKINFDSNAKRLKLEKIIRKARRYESRTRRIPLMGSTVRKELEKIGCNKQQFPEASMFLINKRNMSSLVFSKIILTRLRKRLSLLNKKADTIDIKKWRKLLKLTQSEVAKACNTTVYTISQIENGKIEDGKLRNKIQRFLKSKRKELAEKTKKLLNYFTRILNSNLIQTIVKEKKRIKPNGFFYDLYIPKYGVFFANGILIHNSQARYDRLREDAINEFLTKVGEKASELFLEQKDLKGVIIGGPGPIKERFVREKYLNYQIQKKVLGIKDVSYTDEYGLKELVNRSQDLLEKTALAKEREIMQRFFSELGKGGNVVYGLEETYSALEKGAIEALLISEDLDLVRVSFKCQNQHRTEKILPKDLIKKQKCEICKNPLAAENIISLVDELSEKAKKIGAEVHFISSSTDEGKEFRKLGGIGGFLKWR